MAMIMLSTLPFVHPGIAGIALLTGLIPILVHLINRRRFVHVRWAAMSFLLAASRRSARRIRIERWLLLLTRVGLLVLFGLAVARPYVPATSFLPLQTSRVHHVLLLDNSMSMNARTDGELTRFALAKRYAMRLLESFAPTDPVSIVTLGAPAEAVVAQAAYDRRFVRERLAAVRPTQRATDTVGALAHAAEILEASQVAAGNRALYLISDLPCAVWQDESPEQPTPAVRAMRRLADGLANRAVDLTIVRVASGSSDNLAVTRLETQSPMVGVNLPVRIQVEVTNYGSSVARDATVQIRRDGQIIRRQSLPRLEPGGSASTTITTLFSMPGTHLIVAKISDAAYDALEHDDTRNLSIEVRQTTPVLVIDGRPGVTRLTGEAGFLATALAPRVLPAESTLIEPKIITEPELASEALADHDVVVLCNVQRLSAEDWKQLEEFVTRGGGLLIFGGDLLSVDNYNRHGYADGAGLMPGRFGRAVPASSDGGTSVGFKPDDLVHPIVSEFAGHAESGLFLARVDRYLPIDLDPHRGEIILRYTNDDPALIASSFGRGSVLFCTTTANMSWTNLPGKGDYVSLMLSAVAFLSPRHGDHRNVMVGQSIHERLSPTQSSLPLRVTTRDGATLEPSLVSDGEALALEYGPLESAGAVRVSIGSEVRTFTANVDPAESDLAAVTEEALVTALDRDVRLVTDTTSVVGEPATARSTELASIGLYLVTCLVLVEMWMALWFGSQRAHGSRRP